MYHVLLEAVASISPDTNKNVQRKPYQGSEETERHEGVQVIATGLTEAPAPGSKRYQCQGEAETERFQRHYHHYQSKQYPHGQGPQQLRPQIIPIKEAQPGPPFPLTPSSPCSC